MEDELVDFALLHLNNLLLISIFGIFLGGLTFVIVRYLRKSDHTGPIIDRTLKHTRRFNIGSTILFFLLLYFLSQLLAWFTTASIVEYAKMFIVYLSFFLSIIIGIKLEYYLYKKRNPDYDTDLGKKKRIKEGPVNGNHKKDGSPYYLQSDQIPRSWDNLSNNFWKPYDKKVMIYAFLVLIPIMVISLLFVFVMLYALLDNILISTIIMAILAISFLTYIVIKLRTLLFLNKVRKWEYTSLSHPDLPFEWMRDKLSKTLDKGGYYHSKKTHKFMGNRYVYHYVRDTDVCIRLMYSNSPIPNDYTISIGPDSGDQKTIEEIKEYLSGWAEENIRPKIGYYKILDANHLMPRDRSNIGRQTYVKKFQ